MLETPPEVRRQARMRVRFVTGVKAGEEAELPSSRIGPLVGSEPTSKLMLAPLPRLRKVELPVQVGAEVAVAGDKVGFTWTVVRLEPDRGRAEIVTTIFEKETRRNVECGQLRVLPSNEERTPPACLSFAAAQRNPGESRASGSDWAAVNLRPERPKRALEMILDSLVFSQRCLQSYRDRLTPGLPLVESSERLREEIRRRGLLECDGRPGEYGCLCVPNRFDVVLDIGFEPGVATTIDKLHYPDKARAKWGGARRQHKQRGRRAA